MELKDLLSELEFQWCKSIDEIERLDWIRIFGNRLIKSHEFFKAMEQSCFSNIEYHYLLIRKQGIIVSIIPCFCYDLDLLHLVTSKAVKLSIQIIRYMFPCFFQMRTFVTGSYAATCEHFIEYDPNLKEEVELISQLLNQQLKKKYKDNNSRLLFIKDIKERSITNIHKILDPDFNFFISFPTTVIPVFGDELPYPQALKKKTENDIEFLKRILILSLHGK